MGLPTGNHFSLAFMASKYRMKMMSRCWPIAALPFFTVGFANAIELSRLWLPVEYQSEYLKLKRSAEQVFATERCREVLSGTMSLSQSRVGFPVFRVTCRDDSGLSFSRHVSGHDFTILPSQVELKLRERKREHFWRACRKAMSETVAGMHNLVWLQSEPLQPDEFSQRSAVFERDFDSTNAEGIALHYQAKCEAKQSGATQVIIRKRDY